MPCGAPRVPRRGSIEPLSVELWRRFQRRRCFPPAWRCESRAPRISPFSFDGDKRGRVRQFHEAVAIDQKFFWSDVSLRLLADPRAIPYLGPQRHQRARRVFLLYLGILT